MKRKHISPEMILCAVLAVVLAVALGGIGGYTYWEYQQPRFRDVTMELGQPLPGIETFMTEFADPGQAQMVTLREELDLSGVGQQPVTFRCGSKEETVTLTIQDTTAPVVTFRDAVLLPGKDPKPEDLVAAVTDASEVTVSFVSEPAAPERYGKAQAEVLVMDASGNTVTGQSSIIWGWLPESYTLELGQTLLAGDLLWSGEPDESLVDQAWLDTINTSGVGDYVIESTNGELSCQCVVMVRDTTAPELQIKDVRLGLGSTVTAEDFVSHVQDVSGEVTLRFAQEPDLTSLGTQTVTVEAVDASGNVASAQAVLEIREDVTPPQIVGTDEMRVEIGSTPDYTTGVYAVDDKDDTISVTFDASREDTSKSGSYFVIYTATDSAGNTTTVSRKVIVDHDQEEVSALVKELADSLSDDPMEIFSWMQDKFTYNHSWGDGDPVWYGFTKWKGNCYVHAYCLQVILLEKGYDARIIWTTDQTHYWVILEVEEGVWRHLDATPGEVHSRYGLMVDWQRSSTLSGRTWDRSAWPAAE